MPAVTQVPVVVDDQQKPQSPVACRTWQLDHEAQAAASTPSLSDALGMSIMSTATDTGLSSGPGTATGSPASSTVSSPARCHNPYVQVLRPEHIGLWERAVDPSTIVYCEDNTLPTYEAM